MPKGGEKLTVYHELDPTYYSATSKTFIGRVYALLGLRNIADAADKTGSGYPQLSAEYIVSAEPDADRPRRHEVLRADRGERRKRGRAGARSRRSRTATWSASSDDVASRWGPRVVDFMRLVAAKVRAAAG